MHQINLKLSPCTLSRKKKQQWILASGDQNTSSFTVATQEQTGFPVFVHINSCNEINLQ